MSESSLCFADLARLMLWSRYGTGARFAEDLGLSPAQMRRLLRAHEWELMHPPGLRFQNKAVPIGDILSVKRKNVALIDGFVGPQERAACPNTRAQVRSDRHAITVSFICDEPHPEAVKASVPAKGFLTPVEQAFWAGDFMRLRKAGFFAKGRNALLEWAANHPAPVSSVLLDDCVVVFLTPVAIGKDRSHLFPLRYVPDPQRLAATAPAFTKSRIRLEGAFYFIAINSNGAILQAFYDPYDTGTFCPAWHSMGKASATLGPESWRATVRIPWKELKPVVNEDCIWAIDLCRIRRGNAKAGTVTRGRKTTFVKFDLPIHSCIIVPTPAPEVTPTYLARRVPADRFPTRRDWSEATRIRNFYEDQSGRPVGGMEVRLVHDTHRLFVRFDCRDPDLSRLTVVTRAEEETESGVGNRRCNYLDRREEFGMDWGDYVEVILAPNLDYADRFHGGYFDFVVNSRGDLLERWYDEYGAFAVPPAPTWKSGSAVRVTKRPGAWTVVLALPFDVLCTEGKVSRDWGVNLHRCRSSRVTGRDEEHILWSPTYNNPRHPSWMHHRGIERLRDVRRLGVMRIDSARVALRPSRNRPQLAPARIQKEHGAALHRYRGGDRLASVCFPDAKHGWAVGVLGTILHTCNGGRTWEEQESGTGFMLERVFFLDNRHGWIAGGWPRDPHASLFNGMGVILHTDDAGRHWRCQLDAESLWLNDIFFRDRGHGWAVGEYGTVMRTTDGGRRWRHVRRVPTASWLYGVHFADCRNGWAAGHDETILRTCDGGETWELQACPVGRRPYGWPTAYRKITFADRHNGWIVGDHGNILHTSDGGATWSLDAVDAEEPIGELCCLTDVCVASDGAVWTVSPFAALRRAPTDCAWRVVNMDQNIWLRGIGFADGRHGWAVGELNGVIRTTDGGKTWTRQRRSPRSMGVLYASQHDHHINSAPMGMLGEEFDTAYVLCCRGIRSFEQRGDVSPHMVAASALTRGVSCVHSFTEFAFRESRAPHRIAQRYQTYGGIAAIEKRLVAAIRMLRPMVLVAEDPILQEGYYAHGIAEMARALIAAFDSAADPRKFPELLRLGLKPWAPKKLYILCSVENELYRIHRKTLTVHSDDRFSARLGTTYGDAAARASCLFWGLLDRGASGIREPSRWGGSWDLHLKKGRIKARGVEKGIYDGLPATAHYHAERRSDDVL